MSLLAPWALAGLLALPVIWWLHRRRRRLPEATVPSLLFLEEEAREEHAPERRRVDAELLLALAGAALLVLAAVGPVVEPGPPGRTVRLVVLSGTAARANGTASRIAEAIASVRDALGPSDRLVVVREPAAPTGARPSVDALLDAARAAPAAARIVVSDRLPARPAGDVRWVGVGDPAATNVGLVAASVSPVEGGVRLFASVANDSDRPARAVVSVLTEARVTKAVPLPPGGVQGVAFDLPGAPEEIEVRVGSGDDLAEDDRVLLTRRPLGVAFDPSVPAAHAEAVRRGLTAALGPEGFREDASQARLRVTAGPAPATGTTLVLAPLPEGAVPVPVGTGADRAAPDPLARDLSTVGVDLVFAPGADRPGEGAEVLLARRADRLVPVVERRGSVVRFAPDPLLGSPPPVRTPLWPLFLENLVREVAGEAGPLGYRRSGVLDLATSRLGRDHSSFDPAWLADAPADLPARSVPLRPWLLGAALTCLAALWWGRRARRDARGRRLSPAALPGALVLDGGAAGPSRADRR